MTAIKDRKDVPAQDKWDLTPIYATPAAWEADFELFKTEFPKITQFKGTLGTSPEALLAALAFDSKLDRLGEKLGQYAHLESAGDVADQTANERLGRLSSAYTQAGSLSSYLAPEINDIPEATLRPWMDRPEFKDYRIGLERLLRAKPYKLTEEGEKLMALGGESRGALQKTFSSLTNADLNFGTITTPEGEKPLTQSTYTVFLQNPDPKIRRQAYDKFYGQFQAHENTLASLYAGSIQQDVFKARARGYSSSRAMALFPDNVPETVYDNLVATVRAHLPVLHRYYDLRRRLLGLDVLHHSDMYAPLVGEVEMHHTYDQACAVTLEALKPLGPEYTATLGKGLAGGWVDRYENKGKRSGAFSSGGYDTWPYILLNFKEDNLRDVFTLAHEAGHSMHSWYSVRSNPYQTYHYTIFEAEVASTFNEQLLGRHLAAQATDPKQKAYITSKLIEDTVATLFRQTMFAEFEHKVHAQAEAGGALTLDFFKQTYSALLRDYFGPNVQFEPYSALEGLRIPHFYNAFYVYKYATGLSAAMALSHRVLTGGASELADYLNFLKSGGSRFPLESLALGGVDMSQSAPIQNAMTVFGRLLDELDAATR